MKKVRRRKEAPAASIAAGPHGWIYGSTAALLRDDCAPLALPVIEACMEAVKADKGGEITFTKNGPGIVTIRIEPVDPSDPPSFKRIALVGNEKLAFEGAYVGKREGVIIKMVAQRGVILGVDSEVHCELALSEMNLWSIDGIQVKTEIENQMSKIGPDVHTIRAVIDTFAAQQAERIAEVAAEERRKYVEQRETEYASQNWGGW